MADTWQAVRLIRIVTVTAAQKVDPGAQRSYGRIQISVCAGCMAVPRSLIFRGDR